MKAANKTKHVVHPVLRVSARFMYFDSWSSLCYFSKSHHVSTRVLYALVCHWCTSLSYAFVGVEHGQAQTFQYNNMFDVVSPWAASASIHQAHNISSDSMHLGPQAAQHLPLKSMFFVASLIQRLRFCILLWKPMKTHHFPTLSDLFPTSTFELLFCSRAALANTRCTRPTSRATKARQAQSNPGRGPFQLLGQPNALCVMILAIAYLPPCDCYIILIKDRAAPRGHFFLVL